MAIVLQSLFGSSLKGDYLLRDEIIDDFSFEIAATSQVTYSTSFTRFRTNPSKRVLGASTTSGTVCVFDACDHGLMNQSRHSNSKIRALDWVDDRKFACGMHTRLSVYDITAFAESTAIKLSPNSSPRDISCQENILAFADADGSFGIADQRIDAVVNMVKFAHYIPKIMSCPVASVAQDGNHCLATGGGTDGTIKVWDIRTLKAPVYIHGRSNPNTYKGQGVVALQFGPSGTLYFGRLCGKVGIIEKPTTSQRHVQYLDVMSPLHDLAVDAEERGLAVACKYSCRAIDLAPICGDNGMVATEIAGGATATGVVWDAAGSIGFVTDNGEILHWQRRAPDVKNRRDKPLDSQMAKRRKL